MLCVNVFLWIIHSKHRMSTSVLPTNFVVEICRNYFWGELGNLYRTSRKRYRLTGNTIFSLVVRICDINWYLKSCTCLFIIICIKCMFFVNYYNTKIPNLKKKSFLVYFTRVLKKENIKLFFLWCFKKTDITRLV